MHDNSAVPVRVDVRRDTNCMPFQICSAIAAVQIKVKKIVTLLSARDFLLIFGSGLCFCLLYTHAHVHSLFQWFLNWPSSHLCLRMPEESPDHTFSFQGIRDLADRHLKVAAMLGVVEDLCAEVIDEDAALLVSHGINSVWPEVLPIMGGSRFRSSLSVLSVFLLETCWLT